MGMSASQARLLAITSRINDVEYKSQQISNIKIRLADESEEVANAYSKALNKTKITYRDYNTNNNGQVSKYDLNSSNMSKSGYELKARNGGAVPNKYDAATLYDMIESGEYYLEKSGKEVSVSGDTTLIIETDTNELAKAEAEYTAATAKINTKEKKLDNQLKALDTEHNALSTEFDSVKSLIGDNVEKSFNLFS